MSLLISNVLLLKDLIYMVKIPIVKKKNYHEGNLFLNSWLNPKCINSYFYYFIINVERNRQLRRQRGKWSPVKCTRRQCRCLNERITGEGSVNPTREYNFFIDNLKKKSAQMIEDTSWDLGVYWGMTILLGSIIFCQS